MTERRLKSGPGWRLGWDPQAECYCGLVGNDDWAIELTAAELDEFCQLFGQLAASMAQMATELMAAERLYCEAEGEFLWLEVEGFPHAYELRLIVNAGRRAEGAWVASAVPGLLAATQTLRVF
ncbi:MAG: DUF1818 family protein [Cyanobacteria bacterium J06641_5]